MAVRPTLQDVRFRGQKSAAQMDGLGNAYGAKLSQLLTLALAQTAISPNGVTALGIACGLAAGGLLWLPLSPLALLIVILYQLSYLLDFSDGELARLRNRSSHAGSYLDWLGHFYVPVISAGILGIQLSAETGIREWALLGLLAAVGLGAFHFSCKEHIVVAYLRRHPEDAATPEVQNVLRDRPLKIDASVAELPPNRSSAGSFAPIIGSALIYPGAMHLLCVALLVDLALTSIGGPPNVGRGILLGIWAAAFIVHAALAMRRNFSALRRLDDLDRQRRLSQE